VPVQLKIFYRLRQLSNLVVSFLEEEDVAVEYFNKELDLNGFIHALRSNTHSLLQTVSRMLPVSQLNTPAHMHAISLTVECRKTAQLNTAIVEVS